MSENYLVMLFEHNIWANHQIVQVCASLSNEQLDVEPQSVTKGSIRQTLLHLASSQQGYLSLLTQPVEARRRITPAFVDLQESVRISGEGLLAVARGEQKPLESQLKTTDGYYVEPWVVMLQVINHASEHREQIKSMLSDLGVPPPDIDGWSFGEVSNALIPIET